MEFQAGRMRKLWSPGVRVTVRGALVLLVLFVLATGIAGYASAQAEAELRLRLRRDFGFGAGSQIQGRFSLIVGDVEDLARVAFFVDDVQIGEDLDAPYRLQFSTGSFELGWHSMHAIGYRADGRELESNTIQRQFVSGNSSLIVVVAVVVLVIGFRVISHVVTRDKDKSSKQGYGLYGGAICPRCGHPFSRHWWAPNLIAGKLDRCPNCGKWHFATRATPQMLASAEKFANELDDDHVETEMIAEVDEETRLRKRLDESRFEDE